MVRDCPKDLGQSFSFLEDSLCTRINVIMNILLKMNQTITDYSLGGCKHGKFTWFRN